jgi:phosphoribosyl-AMP cyclohydrolase
MANTTAMCTSFKGELLTGTHNFTPSTGNTFKAALYFATGSLGAATTAYSTTDEVTNTSGTGYTAGGVTVTNATAPTTSGTTAYWTPSRSQLWIADGNSGHFHVDNAY